MAVMTRAFARRHPLLVRLLIAALCNNLWMVAVPAGKALSTASQPVAAMDAVPPAGAPVLPAPPARPPVVPSSDSMARLAAGTKPRGLTRSRLGRDAAHVLRPVVAPALAGVRVRT